MADMLRIRPIDTLMFRDGRPFNQDDEGAGAAESLFPPPPPTLAGAVRLAIAQQNGFTGKDGWPDSLVGSGVDWQDQNTSLGSLQFGPLMMELDGELLLPAPAHLGRDADEKLHLLRIPQAALFASDKAAANGDPATFPRAATGVEGFKGLEDHWLTFSGMAEVLQGRVPSRSAVIEPDKLFARESRVGIGIATASRRVNDGQLYTARFLRLCDNAAFCLAINGLPDTLKGFTQRLGGEHRHAEFELGAFEEQRPSTGSIGGTYAAIATAPVFLEEEPGPGEGIAGLPGKLVTACIPKPFMLGGWDSRPGDKGRKRKSGPLPLKPVIPASAVFFMRCDGDEPPPQGRSRIGLSTAWGFGHCLIGSWPTK